MSSSMRITGYWLVSAHLPLSPEEKLKKRDSIWWVLHFSSGHIKYEPVNCSFNTAVLWCRKLGLGMALLSLHYFCMLCSHLLHVSLFPITIQPEGIRREETQNSLICTKGKCSIYCCPERKWREGWSFCSFLLIGAVPLLLHEVPNGSWCECLRVQFPATKLMCDLVHVT